MCILLCFSGLIILLLLRAGRTLLCRARIILLLLLLCSGLIILLRAGRTILCRARIILLLLRSGLIILLPWAGRTFLCRASIILLLCSGLLALISLIFCLLCSGLIRSLLCWPPPLDFKRTRKFHLQIIHFLRCKLGVICWIWQCWCQW